MPLYKAPLDDMRFILHEVLKVSDLGKIKEFETLDADTVNQFLAEVAKVAEDVLFPLNAVGDREGCIHDREAKTVKTPAGFKEAYEQFCAAGLPAFACDPAYGGLGMPVAVNTAISEMLCSANMAFTMYPGLSHGAYNALHEYGTEAQKQKFLPKLVTGEWTGTMCLTEPQCGTDLGLIKTRAVKQQDGSYKITGTKIFISAGEHDMASNILHLVLAKIEDPSTPPGIKGISLFIVPKIMEDGSRNPVFCQRIEEKMGIHGNSTCEMGFEEATGWLVGEAHKGMRAMFVMMNEARLGVGLQGLGLSEVAYQNGLAYALDRKQSAPIDSKDAGAPAVSIIHHADVRRELLTVKSQIEGARMLAYWVSMQLDISLKHPEEAARRRAKKTVDLLTPIVKAHLTDNAVDHTNAAMQVFGGHGYIREHGMEQYNRDARITRLYEGTNGIQALDLIGRKVLRENLLPAYLGILADDIAAAKSAGVPAAMTGPVKKGACRLKRAVRRLKMLALIEEIKSKTGMGGNRGRVMNEAAAMATDYLKMFSYIALGHMWIKMAAVAVGKAGAEGGAGGFYQSKLDTAAFYFDKLMPMVLSFEQSLKSGGESINAMPAEAFAHSQTNIGMK